MVISVAPAFLSLSNDKTVKAVIMQLEQEGKNEKEDPEKDAAKDKKFCDENFVHICAHQHIIQIIETNLMLSQEHALSPQVHHPTVPTPPPDALV